jgi:uracil-DNA glycosylase family 4
MDLKEFRKKQAAWYIANYDQRPIQWGHPGAPVVLIGQAPSRSGMAAGKPFFDQSGFRLRKDWFRVTDEEFYDQDKFYITAMGLVFPGKDPKGGDKKPPLSIAQTWLHKELAYLHPQVLITIGRMASGFLFPGIEYEDLIFNDQRLFGAKTFVVPHPSPINIKWYKDHPDFLTERIPLIRRVVKEAIE